ncbi:predicted protein [Coccidioides posadasii str. Silveira]|uniref:Predicted protein n=2 Tax=Coccidioides posadasii TaxID=199306 RepID=E9CYA8_COCPS|nr:predicted protein [Coccidioides posadasii str. Silveira]KMM72512.1 hypothetical protein CPAG_08805 [Coccidioides posadasii RMSCC 3488]
MVPDARLIDLQVSRGVPFFAVVRSLWVSESGGESRLGLVPPLRKPYLACPKSTSPPQNASDGRFDGDDSRLNLKRLLSCPGSRMRWLRSTYAEEHADVRNPNIHSQRTMTPSLRPIREAAAAGLRTRHDETTST